jgi:hypothetical protein
VPGWDHRIRTGFPFHPKAQADGTDSHNISGLDQMVNTTYPDSRAAISAPAGIRHRPPPRKQPVAIDYDGVADLRRQASIRIAPGAA